MEFSSFTDENSISYFLISLCSTVQKYYDESFAEISLFIKVTRVEVSEIFSTDQRCFRDSMFFSAVQR